MDCLPHNERRSLETQHQSLNVNSQELVSRLATLCLLSPANLATINLSPHQCYYTDAPERPINKTLWLVSWDGLVIHVPWGVVPYSGNNFCRRFDGSPQLWWTLVAAITCRSVLICKETSSIISSKVHRRLMWVPMSCRFLPVMQVETCGRLPAISEG